MKGWVMMEDSGFKTDAQLRDWLNSAKGFVRKLPPK
jgi:hypothetical protein